MIDPLHVGVLMDSLRGNVRLLRKYAALPRDEFLADEEKQYAAKHALQLALQSVIGISDHIVPNELAHGRVQGLVDMDVIPDEFGPTMRNMIGMRNVLVKRYPVIELGQVYDALQTGLDDFDRVARCIVEYLEREGIA